MVAYTGTRVVERRWPKESITSWRALLGRLPAPDIAAIDGNVVLLSEMKHLRPDTKVQQRLFHMCQGTHRHLTRRPNPRHLESRQSCSERSQRSGGWNKPRPLFRPRNLGSKPTSGCASSRSLSRGRAQRTPFNLAKHLATAAPPLGNHRKTPSSTNSKLN